ncbi:hypothetical protein [Nostoc sp.]|uniref:hypothetical protein n=1 Tax=Nostoc sp. TaxID=1180 RepID=UPI002FF68562
MYLIPFWILDFAESLSAGNRRSDFLKRIENRLLRQGFVKASVAIIFQIGITMHQSDALADSFKKVEIENQGAQLDVQNIEKKVMALFWSLVN